MFSAKLTYPDAVLPFQREEIAVVERGKVGPALRHAREARQMTIEDVAATTRISLRFLNAIENSRYDAFASAVYAIGFVRAYARMVGMSEQWAVDTLRTEAGWR